ncbi:MAG: hydroxylamine reductase [Candidatus Cloacimonadia bacterium]
MNMFCYQCQETARNEGCFKIGVCGKKSDTADLQDLLIWTAKGVSFWADLARKEGINTLKAADFVINSLFFTITNANFDNARFAEMVDEGNAIKKDLQANLEKLGKSFSALPKAATSQITAKEFLENVDPAVGILAQKNDDIRSLTELLIYGLKGMAAYAEHAAILGYRSDEVEEFMFRALATTLKAEPQQDEMLNLVVECGEKGVAAMALLNDANTKTYGNPEPTEVNIGVGKNPAILVSGHDLKDFHELLEQTKDTGIDIYTHGEMLPAHGYPTFKQYPHLVGNYGSAWWKQTDEFEKFNGPILMTTNCLVPPRDSYKNRVFTTGVVGFEGLTHIPDRVNGKPKDFSAIIEMAKKSQPPTEIETGSVFTGFGIHTLTQNKDAILDAVSAGLIKRFVVMAGCDGRFPSRDYYTKVAEKLPADSIILTAGCAKYRYNKLPLGKIGDFPRVIDAGQCNDSYSLAVLALTLKDTLKLEDINQLPISFDVAWYEQKAVLVLLALLYLGFKNIRLGPTLPAFLSPNIAEFLVKTFDIKPIDTPETDVTAMMAGK